MQLDDALKTFIVESRDLLQQMEEALLQTEENPEDPELINAIFRAAHTIKGSAGLFGLEHIVGFTHVAESVLDRARAHEIRLNETLGALFLEVCDHLGGLIESVARAEDFEQEALERSESLKRRLELYLPQTTASTAKIDSLPEPQENKVERSGGGEVETDFWHISLRFGPEVLRNGMDPLSFLRYLATLGRIVSLVTVIDELPALSKMDAEACYLGFEIGFDTQADKASIDSAFDFVREDCRIRILPPHSRIADYLECLLTLPHQPDMRLGEMLIQCGTLTPAELEAALELQAEQEEEKRAPIGRVLVEENFVREPLVDAALDKQKAMKETKANDASMIRVEAAKLDQLINLVGELIIAGAGTHLAAQRAGRADLLEATTTLSRLVEEIRDSALTLRMVQIGATFSRFRRVVRDVSKELGKDIRLEIFGGETELDKTVVEKIGDPLTHLVRNSMDHGIEAAAARLAKGKSAQGKVSLNAYHDSGSIVIEISDDGGGINRERVIQKAKERGIIEEGDTLLDKEVYALLFEPGFSTAEQVSSLSGRGVGMDVVKRNITALRGSVDIESLENLGTTVRIRLPLTLAIIDGFLIGVGKSSFVIPLDLVVECIELPSEEAAGRDVNYLNLRGEVLPFISLRELFEIEGFPPRRENVVVVQYAGQRAGIVVDQLLGEFQTVIKPLGKVFSHIRSIGGSTILGSGEVALILDVGGLVQQVSAAESRRLSAHQQ